MKKITYIYKKIIFNFKKKINIDEENLENKNLDELFTYFGTDKADNVKNQYRKNSSINIGHGYSKFYEKHFEIFTEKKFNLLEIGTWQGSSCAAFAKYFKNAEIFGIDRNFKFKYKSKKIKFIHCDLRSKNDLDKLEKEIKDKKFKIIIDDGSHILSHLIKNLFFFIKYLEKGGYFVVEDFNFPKIYNHLNDSKNEELFFDEILQHINQKKYFSSKLLSNDMQSFIFDNIQNIYIYKGKEKNSDIAFLKKNEK